MGGEFKTKVVTCFVYKSQEWKPCVFWWELSRQECSALNRELGGRKGEKKKSYIK